MLRITLFLLLATLGAQAESARPSITGISHLAVYAADPAAADRFYVKDLGATKAADPEDSQGVRYYFSPQQYVEVLPLPAGQGISRLAHLGFSTGDASALKAWLSAHGGRAVSPLHRSSSGDAWFETRDPEGNTVQFTQTQGTAAAAPSSISRRIIHVGMLVRSQSVEDAFYRQLLGFRPYWFGAMTEGKKDWVSQQVPDGHDWLEYMLVGEGSDTPADRVDARTLGVLNHFSLGVANMEAAVTTLYRGDRLPPRHDGPQMGKDGKWQANLYDPDGTRVELMEFQPAMEPCCSPFTAESPAN